MMTMEEDFRIEVRNNNATIGFEFSNMGEALNFAQTCYEACDPDTEVILIKKG